MEPHPELDRYKKQYKNGHNFIQTRETRPSATLTAALGFPLRPHEGGCGGGCGGCRGNGSGCRGNGSGFEMPIRGYLGSGRRMRLEVG